MSFFNPAYWCIVLGDKETNEITGYVRPCLVQRGSFEYWSNSKSIIREIQDSVREQRVIAFKEDFPVNRIGVIVYAKAPYAASAVARVPIQRNVEAIHDIIKQVKDSVDDEQQSPIEQKITPPESEYPTAWLTGYDPEHPTWTIIEPIDGKSKKSGLCS